MRESKRERERERERVLLNITSRNVKCKMIVHYHVMCTAIFFCYFSFYGCVCGFDLSIEFKSEFKSLIFVIFVTF